MKWFLREHTHWYNIFFTRNLFFNVCIMQINNAWFLHMPQCSFHLAWKNHFGVLTCWPFCYTVLAIKQMVTWKHCDYLTLTPPESFGWWPCIFCSLAILYTKDSTNHQIVSYSKRIRQKCYPFFINEKFQKISFYLHFI